jgi:FlaG/FlaF family flagellin (archaellin)
MGLDPKEERESITREEISGDDEYTKKRSGAAGPKVGRGKVLIGDGESPFGTDAMDDVIITIRGGWERDGRKAGTDCELQFQSGLRGKKSDGDVVKRG